MQIFKSNKLSVHAFYQQVNTVKPEIRTPPLAKQLCMSSYIFVASAFISSKVLSVVSAL
jgi:hypothetical protein